MSRLVLVCGSRGWTDRQRVFDRLDKLGLREGDVLMHGHAPEGADVFADDWLSLRAPWGVVRERHPARWQKHGRRAIFVRNVEMLDRGPDLVLAFWDGASPGTAHVIREARARGIPCEVEENP